MKDAFGLPGLRPRRIEVGWTTRELSRRVGYHHEFLGRVERGEQTPTAGVIDKLAAILNCTTDLLIRGYQQAAS